VLSLTLIGSGCASLPPTIANRTLPPEASVVLDPVPVPTWEDGDDARVVLDKTGDALDEANTRLVKSRNIYRKVRKKFAGK
jgi:hypothetical protein